MDEKTILSWLEEAVSEPNVEVSESDGDLLISEHDTDTEQSDQSEDMQVQVEADAIQTTSQSSSRNTHVRPFVCSFYTGKDGTKWNIHKPPQLKTARQNIVKKLPSVVRTYRDHTNIIDCWRIFFPARMISDIVRFTNQQIEVLRTSYARERDCKDTDFFEMSAFIGMLYLIGIKKGQHINKDELWCNDGTAPDILAATMSKKRFHTLIQAIRFDDRTSRAQRKQTDNAAAIRDIFEEFVQIML